MKIVLNLKGIVAIVIFIVAMTYLIVNLFVDDSLVNRLLSFSFMVCAIFLFISGFREGRKVIK